MGPVSGHDSPYPSDSRDFTHKKSRWTGLNKNPHTTYISITIMESSIVPFHSISSISSGKIQLEGTILEK